MNFSEKFLLAEWLGLFWGIPLVLLTRIYPFNLLWLLFAATFICGFYLVRNKNFANRRLGGWSKMRLVWKGMLVRGLLCAGLLLVINLIFWPENMFGLPRFNYKIWILVFVLYPLLSAWPQELIYRAFMFQRYRRLFTNDMAMVIASAAAFAFLHVLFRNWLAIGLTFIAGIIFAMDYHKTKALTPAFIEHALYGNLIFTIGLGHFFYQGAVGG